MQDDQGYVARLEQGLLEGEEIIKKIEKAQEENLERIRGERALARKEKKRAEAAAAAAAEAARLQEETAAREREVAAAIARQQNETVAREVAENEGEENEVAAATVEVDGEVGVAGDVERVEGQGKTAVDGGSMASAGILRIPGKKSLDKWAGIPMMRASKGPYTKFRNGPCLRCKKFDKKCIPATASVCTVCKRAKARCEDGKGAVESEKKRGKKRARSPCGEFEQGSSSRPLNRPRETIEIPSSGEEAEKRREAEDEDDPRDEAVVVFERMARKTEGIAKDFRALAAAFAKYEN